MATFSPVTLNKTNSDTVSGLVGSNGTLTPQRSISVDAPKQNLRGMNKPKCIKCGNIARSRCDFQSCKGCCSKAQNPCLIHVLKQSTSTLPDKPPPSVAPLPEQPISDAPPKGASTRLSSLRQLSSTYVNSLRSKRPLSRKDAIGLNMWRFGKLREYIEGNVRSEDEAFDRYIQNVGLLEEVFFVDKDADGIIPPLTEDIHQKLVLAIKSKMQVSVERAQTNRHRIQVIVSNGLKKLQKMESDGHAEEFHDDKESGREFKRRKNLLATRSERNTLFSDLIDKLVKARTDEDFKLCLETKQKLYNEEQIDIDQTPEICSELMLEMSATSKPIEAILAYSCPNLCTVKAVHDFPDIEARYASLDQIALL